MTVNRIKIGWLVCACTIFFLLLSGCRAVTDRDTGAVRPNILLIVLDDFGYNDLAINNGSDSPTPNLDQLAREGLRFTRHYAESSCTPSRIALLTGRYPARLGFHPIRAGLSHEVETLADVLSANGYNSHMIGKWHAGDTHRESRPEFQGFDHWFGFMNQLYLAGPHKEGMYTRGRPTYHNPWLENEKGELQQHQGHLTDILSQHALEVMRTETDPWFIYLPYYAPHGPIEPATDYAREFSDDSRGRFQALKSQLDTNIGRLLTQLRDSGQWRNTMVLVVSDNGGTGAAYPSNYPFPGVKVSNREGGIRTPLILSWPGHWEGGEIVDGITMIFDIFPTIVAALGISAPAGIDGTDIFAAQSPRVLRWYSHYQYVDTFADIHSVLSANGLWRLNARETWEDVEYALFKHLNYFNSGQKPEPVIDPGRVQSLSVPMQSWISDVTRVKDLAVADTDQWRAYSLHAFRRTPMLGTHSMGFVFRSDNSLDDGGGPRTLVAQNGYIDIREQGDELLIEVDGHPMEIAFPKRSSQCSSVVISSFLRKNNQILLSENSVSTIQVYVNGEPALLSKYRNRERNTASPQNPLRVRIGTGNEGGWYMPSISQAILSTRYFRPEEVASQIHPELIKSCMESL